MILMICPSLILTCCSPLLHAQPVPDRTQKSAFPDTATRNAVQLRKDGKWRESLGAFQAEHLSIVNDPDQGPVAAQKLFELGRLQFDLAGEDSDPEVKEKALEGAAESFRSVVRMKDPKSAALARVHLASVYMQKNDAGNALKELEACDRSQFDSQQLTVLDYNIGRALQEQKRLPDAAKAYRTVLANNPGFVPAADRLIDVTVAQSLQENPSEGDSVRRLSDEFLKSGNPDQAIKLARRVIQARESRWEDKVVRDAVGGLCSGWAAKYRGPQDDQIGLYVATLRDADCPADLIKDLERVATGSGVEVGFEILESLRASNLQFKWTQQGSASLTAGWSEFVTSVADWYAFREPRGTDQPLRPRNAERALFLYLLAWGTDRQNTRASLGVVSLFSKKEDPEFFRKYFDRVFDAIFHAKSGMYVAQPETESDWETLVHFHTVLGKLLDQRGDSPGSPDDARSPLGQWSLAINAEDEVRKRKGRSFVGSIELYERLAACYQRSEQVPRANDAWLTGAERAVAVEDVLRATEILKAVSDTGLSPSQTARRDQLQARIKSLQQPVKR